MNSLIAQQRAYAIADLETAISTAQAALEVTRRYGTQDEYREALQFLQGLEAQRPGKGLMGAVG